MDAPVSPRDEAYLACIAADDRAGPSLNSVREVNLTRSPSLHWLMRRSRRTAARSPVSHPRQGQHRNSRWRAYHRRFPCPRICGARQDSTVVRQLRAAGAAILGEGKFDRICQLHRDRHAGRLQLAGRAGEERTRRRSTTRGCRSCRRAGRVRAPRSRSPRGCARRQSTETSGSLLNPATQNGLSRSSRPWASSAAPASSPSRTARIPPAH